MKRLFDLIFSFIVLIPLFPVSIVIVAIIVIDNYGNPFFLQKRVGKNNTDFELIKFRTMYFNSDKKGLLTVGSNDNRITRTGKFLRKYKLDELPQLFNVMNGSMSLVGPRPEVRKYVELYTKEQLKVLNIKPGITDYASIIYKNENELLAQSSDPEKTYINEIMPHKLELNLKYIKEKSFLTDVKIIMQTIKAIVR